MEEEYTLEELAARIVALETRLETETVADAPHFAGAIQGQPLSGEEESVARRYRNNPWYRRK